MPVDYAFGRVLERSGALEVREANHAATGREVIVERLNPEPRPSEDERRNFWDAAKLRASLEHSAFLPIYAIGTDPTGAPFLARKRASGVTFVDALARGGPARAHLRVLSRVAVALDYLHAQGVCLGGVDSSGIELGAHGEVWIGDFSRAARFADEGARSDDVRSLGRVAREVIRATDGEAGTSSLAPFLSEIEGSLPPTAREVHERLEAILAGETERADRQTRAAEEVAEAERVLRAAPAGDADAESSALARLSLALELDPENGRALARLGGLLADQPEHLPEEAEREIERSWTAARAASSQRSAVAYAFAALVLAVAFAVGRVHPATWSAPVLLLATALHGFFFAARRREPMHRGVNLTLKVLATGSLAFVAGPLILLPTALVAAAIITSLHQRAAPVGRQVITGVSILALAIPIAIDATGALPPPYSFAPAGVGVIPRLVDFPPAALAFVLVAGALVPVVFPLLLAGRAVDALLFAKRKLAARSALLRAAFPGSVGGGDEGPESEGDAAALPRRREPALAGAGALPREGSRSPPTAGGDAASAPTLVAAATIEPTITEMVSGVRSLDEGSLDAPLGSFSPAGYALVGLLGRGGMGDVYFARDREIGRMVALKTLRETGGSMRSRFLREAAIQARLEHPSVVTVYAIGESEGRSWFAMRRIRGETLESQISASRRTRRRSAELGAVSDAGDLAAVSDAGDGRRQSGASRAERADAGPRQGGPSLSELIRAVSELAQALAYAHDCGVVHRDIKPANVILGEYGELYVLDWGVARAVGPDEPPPSGEGEGGDAPGRERIRDSLLPPGDSDERLTSAGAVVGTPGFIAPEQIESRDVGPPADVYAVGAILYEICAGEVMIESDDALEALRVALATDAHRPSARDSTVPAALDDICAACTARNPRDRPSAQAVHERIDAYLAFEAHAERRKALAARRIDEGRKLLASDPSPEAQARAVRRFGAALALDAESDAAEALLEALANADDRMPEAARRVHEAAVDADRRRASRRSPIGYVVISACIALLAATVPRSLPELGLIVVIALTTAAAGWGTTVSSSRWLWALRLVLPVFLILSLSVLLGPLVLTPQIAVAIGTSLIVTAQLPAGRRRAVASAFVVAMLLPLALGAFGLIPTSYALEGGVLFIRPWAIELSPPAVYTLVIGATLIALALPLALIGRTLDELARAERRDAAFEWRVRRLLGALLANRRD